MAGTVTASRPSGVSRPNGPSRPGGAVPSSSGSPSPEGNPSGDGAADLLATLRHVASGWAAAAAAEAPGVERHSASDGPGTAHSGADDSQDCRFCPVCQGLAALRRAHPQAVEHLEAALTSLLAAVRELAAAQPAQADWPPGGRPTSPPTVERIDISD